MTERTDRDDSEGEWRFAVAMLAVSIVVLAAIIYDVRADRG